MRTYSDIKSTPGPWANDGEGEIVSPHGNPIVKVYSISDFPCFDPDSDEEYEEAEQEYSANALLVAAAPDMLKMLITLREYILSEIPAKPGTFTEALINCTNDTIALAFGDETSELFKEARALEVAEVTGTKAGKG